MKRILISTITLILSQSMIAAGVDSTPYYQAGSHYNAVLNSAKGTLQLLPSNGDDFTVQLDAHCRNTQKIPAGIWLLTRDASGALELVAPSQTVLPAGHSGAIAIISCDVATPSGSVNTLKLPGSMLDWLEQHAGNIYVE
jgi:hypothetical protein